MFYLRGRGELCGIVQPTIASEKLLSSRRNSHESAYVVFFPSFLDYLPSGNNENTKLRRNVRRAGVVGHGAPAVKGFWSRCAGLALERTWPRVG